MRLVIFLFLIIISKGFPQCGPGTIPCESEGISSYMKLATPPTTTPDINSDFIYNSNGVLSSKDSLGNNRRVGFNQDNLIDNFDIELGLLNYIFTAGRLVLNTATPLLGLKSLSFDSTSINDFVETIPYLVKPGLYGSNCMAQILMGPTDGNLTMSIIDGDGDVVGTRVIPSSTNTQTQTIAFSCPGSTTTINDRTLKIKVFQTSAANASLVNLDSFWLGGLRTNQMVVSGQVEEYRASNIASPLAAPGNIIFQTVLKNTLSQCGSWSGIGGLFTATGNCEIHLSCNYRGDIGGASYIYITHNGVAISTEIFTGDSGREVGAPATAHLNVAPGDTLACYKGTGAAVTAGNVASLTMTATPLPQLATIVSMVKPMSPQWYVYQGVDINGSFPFPAPLQSMNDKTLFTYAGNTLTVLKPSLLSISLNSYQPGGSSDSNKRITCVISGVSRLYGVADTNPQGAIIFNTPTTTSPIPVQPGDTCTISLNRNLVAFTSYNVSITATHILDPNNDPNIMAVLPSQTQYLENNLTLYVATTGSDSSGDGSAGKPFATPQAALNYLGRYTFAPGVEVLISVAAGQYILTSSIVPQHPQGAQITIQGAAVATPPVAADFCTPGVIPGRGWSNPTAAQRETCANTDLTMLRGKYPTELRFIRVAGTGNNIDGFSVWGTSIKIANLLISSNYLPNTNVTTTGAGIVCGYEYLNAARKNGGCSVVSTGPISVHGFRNYGFMSLTSSSIANASTATASNNGSNGFYSVTSSSIQNGSTATASNNGSNGFYSNISSAIYNIGTATASNNGSHGFYTSISSSILNGGGATAPNNAGNGIFSTASSSIYNVGAATAPNNAGSGIISTASSSIVNTSTATASNNGGYGLFCVYGATLYTETSTESFGNASGGIYADGQANVRRGAVGGGGIQSYSPAFGGVPGNVNSTIY